MAKPVVHESFIRKGMFGSIVTGTLCGRESLQDDGMNVGEEGEKVTCKICLKLMEKLAADSVEGQPR